MYIRNAITQQDLLTMNQMFKDGKPFPEIQEHFSLPKTSKEGYWRKIARNNQLPKTEKILALLQQGLGNTDIANTLNVSVPHVSRVKQINSATKTKPKTKRIPPIPPIPKNEDIKAQILDLATKILEQTITLVESLSTPTQK